MTTAVTGARGLLGRHVVAALVERGREVRAVDTQPPLRNDVEWVRADLTDLGEAVQALRGAGKIVHAAAIPRPTGRTATDVFRTNVLAAFNVLEAATAWGIERLVNASSVSVLGLPFNPRPISIRYLPIDETHPLAPQEAYALSKVTAEQIVSAAVARSNLVAVSLRMPWIQTAESFFQEVAPRRDDPATAAANLWAYIDARDAAEAFVAALDAPLTGHVVAYVAAADTFMEEPTEELVREAYPDVEWRGELPGHRSVIATDVARELLGFRPRFSWSDYAVAP